MGTNFYKVQKLPRKIKDEMIDAIENDRVEYTSEWNVLKLYDKNKDELVIPCTEIHIGKRSAGWKFLFDHNDWIYYDENKESFINWLKDPTTGVIKDEYGEEYSFDEFWEDVMDTYNTPWIDGHERYDGRTYHLDHPEAPYYGNYEFYLDNLRFSTSTNFS